MNTLARAVRPFLALLVGAVLSACSDSSPRGDLEVSAEEGGFVATDMAMPPPPPAMPAPPPAATYAPQRAVGVAQDASLAQSDVQPVPTVVTSPSPAQGSMIIRTGDARIQVEKLEPAAEQVDQIAKSLGGWVARSAFSLGEREHRSATLEIKVPAERWDALVTGVEGLGQLRNLSTSTEDVGEQFVDLSAQLANSQRLENRYIELLETRTGDLNDLLAVERELARVRERIETIQGRLRYLEQRVAISTLVVTLEEPMNLLSSAPESEPFRDALRAAWRNFLGVITGGIALAGLLVPLAAAAAVLFWGWRAWRRKRRTGPARSMIDG